MILNMHIHTHLRAFSLGGDVLAVGSRGQRHWRGGGAGETAGDQGKGVRNNRNDLAVCCSTGNGVREWGEGRPGQQRPPDTDSFTSSCFFFASVGLQSV